MSDTTNLEKLLEALKERQAGEDADRFSMLTYVHNCGTPACSLGTYAAWDGQTFLDPPTPGRSFPTLRTTGERTAVYYRNEVLQHFGITKAEADMLFDSCPVDGFDVELGLPTMCDSDCVDFGEHASDCDRAWGIEHAIKATEAVINRVRARVVPSMTGSPDV